MQLSIFENIFLKSIRLAIMHVHFRNVSHRPTNNGISEIFKHIEPSKERIKSVLPKIITRFFGTSNAKLGNIS